MVQMVDAVSQFTDGTRMDSSLKQQGNIRHFQSHIDDCGLDPLRSVREDGYVMPQRNLCQA